MFTTLLIEGDPMIHPTLWGILDMLTRGKAGGASIISARSWSDVLGWLAIKPKIDLVVCAGTLEGRSTIEILQTIQATRPESFICLMSGGLQPPMHPADLFLSKPPDAVEFESIVSLATSRKERLEVKPQG